MASTSRKRTRDNSSTDETLHESPKPRKKSRSSCAGRQGQGGKKNLQSSAHPKSTETPPIVASSDAQQGSVNNNTEDPAQQRKKVRLELEDRDVSASDMPESHIFKLPPEIIGEILVLTGSPRHILAFARTCKHFCYTLIGEGTQYIWRRARRGPQCTFLNGPDTISLPDPPKSFFTESACAAFLFDPGPCDVGDASHLLAHKILTSVQNCGKKTSAPYASFALRIRFCNDVSLYYLLGYEVMQLSIVTISHHVGVCQSMFILFRFHGLTCVKQWTLKSRTVSVDCADE